MIEVNELMLGDLVRLTDGTIARIIAIDATGNVDVEFETEHFKHHVNAHEEEIEPIPFSLTELLHNGFILIGSERSEWHYCDETGKMFVIYCKENDGLYYDVPTPIKISYFHQFQHLLQMHELYDLADNLKI